MSDRNVVVLVDESGIECGTASKMAAHRSPGQLHLAFSVVLYRVDGQMLIQQRAASKYHFPLLWANSCCSHPGPGEDLLVSATKRVNEELGVRCSLEEVGSFVYRAECGQSGLVEHELDHVFVGRIDEEPTPDYSEVAALRWVDNGEIASLERSGATVPWLAGALDLVARHKGSSAPKIG